jgi:ParB/RepB/Spo0J family partition protein
MSPQKKPFASGSNPRDEYFLPISQLQPARSNELIYRPVRADDPAIQELARDIKKRGVLEPLVVTKDYCIVSGHRRYAAAKLARLTQLPCIVLKITSADPKLVELLTAYNLQRVKTLDEFLREAIVTANPEETYHALIEHRIEHSDVEHDLEIIELREVKERKRISTAKDPLLKEAQKIVEDNRSFWPLTVRQIHYRLLPLRPLEACKQAELVLS